MIDFTYIIVLMIYFSAILVLCWVANRRTNNIEDYMLARRSLSAPITALGAGASDMGGWLLLALPGAIFALGLSQIWLPLGLTVGAYFNWRLVATRLRNFIETNTQAITIPGYLEARFHDNTQSLRIITAIIVLVFFTCYASAGFVSGALLFKTVFNIHYHTALWICAGIVMAYTSIGGFLALSWIDFLQGSLMFFALLILPCITFFHLPSWHSIPLHTTHHISFITMISLASWGLGYFGQPHILVRFMAIKNPKHMPLARRIGMTWMILSLIGAVGTGLIGRGYFSHGLPHPEAVFLLLTTHLVPAVLAGVLLAAVLSAVMSTSSAQLLAAASALAEDCYHRFLRTNASPKELVLISRATVLITSLTAIGLAYHADASILALVGYAWAGLGASFGPVILISLFWKRMTKAAALTGLILGSITVIIWKLWVMQFAGAWGIFGIFELLPGFIVNTAAIVIISLLSKKS